MKARQDALCHTALAETVPNNSSEVAGAAVAWSNSKASDEELGIWPDA